MADWRSDRIGSALRGENPTVLARMPGGFAVIGDVQWLPGYCVLLADDPEVTRLSELPRVKRTQYLGSLDRLAEAVGHRKHPHLPLGVPRGDTTIWRGV